MAERTERAVLNHLIETCRDAERGFRMAAEQVTTPAVREMFLQFAEQRRQFADALLPHAQRLGGPAVHEGTSAAVLHRAWMQVKARLAPDVEEAIVSEAARGERFAVAAYDEAVQDMLPPETRDLVEAQDVEIHRAADQVMSVLGRTNA